MANIGTADVAELLRRSLGIKGPVSLELLEQLIPVVLVDDLRANRLNAQAQERPFGFRASQTAVAAQSSKIVIQNIAGQDLLIDELIVQAATTMGYQFGFQDTGTLSVGSAINPGYYDAQFRASPLGAAGGYDFFTQTSATLSTLLVQLGGGVSATAYVPVIHTFRSPIVVPPGAAFCLEGLTANVELRASCECRERVRVL